MGSLVSAGIMDAYGRRSTLLLSIMPLLSGWGIIALSTSHVTILVGRVVCGIAVGLMAAPAQVKNTFGYLSIFFSSDFAFLESEKKLA